MLISALTGYLSDQKCFEQNLYTRLKQFITNAPFPKFYGFGNSEEGDDAHTEQFSTGSEHPETQKQHNLWFTFRLLGKLVC